MDTNGQIMKKCAKCGRTLTVDNFSKSSSNKDGLQSYCKECASASALESIKRKKAPIGAKTGFQPTYAHKEVADAQGVVERRVLEGREHKVYAYPEMAHFNARELIEELRARGYRGKLSYTMEVVL